MMSSEDEEESVWHELADNVEPHINSFPLLDPYGSTGTGWVSPDLDFPVPRRDSPATDDEHSLLPYLPPEIQQIIGENLDQITSVAALQGGLGLSKVTSHRAKHAYLWSTVLKSKDFDVVAKATQQNGNVFLIGHGLRSLYDNPHGISEPATSPIQLLLSWQPRDRLRMNMRRFEGDKSRFSDPDLLVQAGENDHFGRIHVTDIGGLIAKEDGKLYTNIVYFSG